MDLAAYVERAEPGEMTRLHRVSGVSYYTIWRVAKKGHRLTDYHSAKKLSDATGGVVSIAELCEPKPVEKKRKRSRARDSDAPDC